MEKNSIIEELNNLVTEGNVLLTKKKDHLMNGIIFSQSVPEEEYLSYRAK